MATQLRVPMVQFIERKRNPANLNKNKTDHGAKEVAQCVRAGSALLEDQAWFLVCTLGAHNFLQVQLQGTQCSLLSSHGPLRSCAHIHTQSYTS